MSMLANKKKHAHTLAEMVLKNLSSPKNEYWEQVTLGEAYTLLGNTDKACEAYHKAFGYSEKKWGNIASSKRQLRLLSQNIRVEKEINHSLMIPHVVVFSGHMIDAPERKSPRFPVELEKQVYKKIEEELDTLNANFGYSSAACGSDILFLEAMQKRGGETHIVLPFAKEDFINISLRPGGTSWLKRFDKVLAKATSVSFATDEGYLGDDILFEYASDILEGMALIRGKQLETETVMLAVLDQKETQKNMKLGGTAATVKRWLPKNQKSPQKETHISRHIKAMLFADLVGFSKLGEDRAPSFFVGFLGKLAKLIEKSSIKPSFCNTWGDGLFIVFDEVTDAAQFALALRDMVNTTHWEKIGLPKETSIRIGMHAGPVYGARDPIIKHQNFYGTHVNRAARIEPVTASGAVYMSEQSEEDLVHLLKQARQNELEYHLVIIDEHFHTSITNIKTLTTPLNTDFILIRPILVIQDVEQINLSYYQTVIPKPISRIEFDETISNALQDSSQQLRKELTCSRQTWDHYQDSKVLIVEDNETNQIVIKEMLNRFQIKTFVVSNGKEAIEFLNRQSVDLIFMDMQMPELDGYQATKLIRAFPPSLALNEIPIIALTAHALIGDKEKCLKAGVNDIYPNQLS